MRDNTMGTVLCYIVQRIGEKRGPGRPCAGHYASNRPTLSATKSKVDNDEEPGWTGLNQVRSVRNNLDRRTPKVYLRLPFSLWFEDLTAGIVSPAVLARLCKGSLA